MSMLLLILAAGLSAAQADTVRYVVMNHGRPAGELVVQRGADGVRVRYGHIDRNRGRWLDTRYVVDADGVVQSFEAQPVDRTGSPTGEPERLVRRADSVVWTSGQQRQARHVSDAGIPVPASRTAYDQARLARALLSAAGDAGRLMPGGMVRVEVVADTMVETDRGRERVRFAVLFGAGGGPAGNGVWLDEAGELFAGEVGWFIPVRRGAEQVLPALRPMELRYREGQAAALSRRLVKPVEPLLVIRNGDVFDAERGEVLPNHTVVVRAGRIEEVGPAASVREPAGARVMDATGRTVVPGLWEMHGHLQHTSQLGASVLQLAQGITTVRDLAADIDVAVSQRNRANAHEIVAPRLVLGGFIEGPGEWAGPSEVLVRTEDEARAWVARYDSMGYRQIKLYNLVHPDLVPAIASEARARGLRLSGHVPRGLSVPAAIRLGFEEINHAAFLFSTFFQDSLYTPAMRPYSGVAAIVAPSFDVDSPAMTSLIEVLREHGTVVDGTFNLWMGGRALLNGQENAGGLSYARLLKRLHDAGVTLVPGTDNISSSTYITELELYEHAGIPAAAVLQMATLVSARVMGEDGEYGSIAAGKVADIVIVNGRPHERIGELQRVEHVIRGGRVYDPQELRAGLQATPRTPASRSSR